jgi:hypothetical protein
LTGFGTTVLLIWTVKAWPMGKLHFACSVQEPPAAVIDMSGGGLSALARPISADAASAVVRHIAAKLASTTAWPSGLDRLRPRLASSRQSGQRNTPAARLRSFGR